MNIRLLSPLLKRLVPDAPQGGRARHPARHRGRDPRRRSPRGDLSRQGEHRGVARGAPHRALGRAALERHDHVRHRRRPVHVARHLVRSRALQKETGGFTEFVPLPFVHMATPIFLQGKARRGPTFREVLLMHAVGRIAYRGWIDNVQASWVKCGVVGARQILQAGANDLGGTLMDENISRGRREPRSRARRVGAPRHRRAARPSARAAHDALRPHPDGRRRLRPPDDHAHGDGGDTPVVLLGARR